ncbi:MAG: glutathione S-transferase family protein [Polyangiaceae bacterium]
MAIEVFWGSGSGPAWRVLLTLAVKNVPYESRLLSFSKGEHRQEPVTSMNPRGKVPVLRDGAYSVYESLAIMTYLDRRFPTPPLFGTTPEDAGTILRVIMEHECYGVAAISAFSRPLLFGKLDAQRDQVLLAMDGCQAELSSLERRLATSPYLATESLSAADLFVFPQIKAFERSLGKPGADSLGHPFGPLATAFPSLVAWCRRVESIPGYEATYPPHWREG